MRFRLNISIDDEEYIDFNKFNLLRSPYGSRYMKKSIILISACAGFIAFCSLLTAIMLSNLFLYIFTLLVAAFIGAYPVILRKVLTSKMEKYIHLHLENGDRIYTPNQAIEFYDDVLVSDDGKRQTKTQYNDIEQICVINRYVYIYSKQKTAYIIKTADFDSTEDYARFLDFIESSFENVDFYVTGKRKPFRHPYRMRVIPADSVALESPAVTEKSIEDLGILPSRAPEAPLMEKVERAPSNSL